MKLLVTFAAVIGYGLWAYFANCFSASVENPEMIATRAGIIQGSYAGALTFVNVYILEWLYTRLNEGSWQFSPTATAVSAATVFQYAMIIPVHLINGTPNIVITLLPGFIIGTLFSAVYTVAFAKKHYATLEAGSASPSRKDI